jgi:argininosuccinate synthase
LDTIQAKALKSGAEQSLVHDAIDELITGYAFPALQANALYENRYPLSTALARPLIAKLLVQVAEEVGADAVAHGCTGKGNDQVRFDLGIAALNPKLKVLAPAREWGMSREETIAYGEKYGIPSPVKKSSPYSIDLNILGRSAEAGVLEDANLEPPEDVYALTKSVQEVPNDPTYVEIEFDQGIPVGINGHRLDPKPLFELLNKLAGDNGIGRLDMIENRLVGIKSREIYEVPALLTLILAHRELESLTLTREVTHYKFGIETTYSQLVYNGLWYSPLRQALDGFVKATQAHVTGSVRMRLHKGQAVCVGRKSPYSLYDAGLATYGEEDQFDHRAAEGFIYVWGLPTRTWSQSQAQQP